MKRKKKRNSQQCVCSCVSFCPFCIFHSEKFFFLKFSLNFPSARASAHDVKKSSFAMCTSETARNNRHIRGEYTCAHQHQQTPREPGSSKSRRQGKRETTQNAVYDFRRRLLEKHSAMYACDSEKTLFINIVLRYIAEAGNRYILSLFFFSTFFSSFFFSSISY